MPCQILHLPQCCNARQAKIIDDVAKIIIKSEKTTPFGRKFYVREQFSRYVGQYVQVLLPNGKQEMMVVTQEEMMMMISQLMQKYISLFGMKW